MATIRVRDVSVPPGQKTFAAVKVGEWADGSAVSIPVSIVHGRDPGPIVAVAAGIHGDEVVGTEAVRRVTAELLNPATLRGAVVGVPIVNVPSYILNARTNVLEDYIGSNDASRQLWTAEPTGSLTERIACFLRDEVLPLCDVYIDLHSSAKGSTNYPRAIIAGEFAKMSPALRKTCDELGEACGYEYVFKPRASSWPGMYFPPSTAFEERLGKAHIVLETGHAPTIAGADVLVRGIRNILVHLKMIEGTIERYGPMTLVDRLVAIRGNRGGIWHPRHEIPHVTTEGEVLGHIADLADSVVEEIRAPVSGIAIKVATQGAVATGTRLYVLGIPY